MIARGLLESLWGTRPPEDIWNTRHIEIVRPSYPTKMTCKDALIPYYYVEVSPKKGPKLYFIVIKYSVRINNTDLTFNVLILRWL